MEFLTSKAKFSGSFGGALSPRKLLQSLSASRLVIIPHLREVIGMAPARRNTSSWKEEAEKETGQTDRFCRLRINCLGIGARS